MDHRQIQSAVKGSFQPCVIVNWAFRMVLRLSGVSVTYIGEDRIPKDTPVLYVGNHRSYFDIVMTYVRVPCTTGYISKVEFLKIPLLSN